MAFNEELRTEGGLLTLQPKMSVEMQVLKSKARTLINESSDFEKHTHTQILFKSTTMMLVPLIP